MSREIKDQSAYSIVKVDERLDTSMIDEIESLDEIITVNQLEL